MMSLSTLSKIWEAEKLKGTTNNLRKFTTIFLFFEWKDNYFELKNTSDAYLNQYSCSSQFFNTYSWSLQIALMDFFNYFWGSGCNKRFCIPFVITFSQRRTYNTKNNNERYLIWAQRQEFFQLLFTQSLTMSKCLNHQYLMYQWRRITNAYILVSSCKMKIFEINLLLKFTRAFK